MLCVNMIHVQDDPYTTWLWSKNYVIELTSIFVIVSEPFYGGSSRRAGCGKSNATSHLTQTSFM